MIDKSILPAEVQKNPEITIGELAEKYGVKYQTMAAALKRCGIRVKRKQTTKRNMTIKSRAFKVLAYIMTNPKMNQATIAKQFNCTREYVSQIEATARHEGIIK